MDVAELVVDRQLDLDVIVQSPIERAFLNAYLAFLGQRSNPQTHDAFVWTDPYFGHQLKADQFYSPRLHQLDIIVPQYAIDRFRVDFLLSRFNAIETVERDDREEFLLRRLPQVIVECDGHDFHERTVQQATADKSRDRRLTALGYRPTRFTGTEITRDANRCAREVDEILNGLFLAMVRGGL